MDYSARYKQENIFLRWVIQDAWPQFCEREIKIQGPQVLVGEGAESMTSLEVSTLVSTRMISCQRGSMHNTVCWRQDMSFQKPIILTNKKEVNWEEEARVGSHNLD